MGGALGRRMVSPRFDFDCDPLIAVAEQEVDLAMSRAQIAGVEEVALVFQEGRGEGFAAGP